MASCLFVFSTLLSTVSTVHGSAFLSQQVEEDYLPTAEIDLLLHYEQTSLHFGSMKSELAPLFDVMPKNANGRLDPAVVRYTLHRFFQHKFGWHVQGLDVVGGAWNSSMEPSVMKDRAAAYIEGLLAQQTGGRGLDLGELTVFAAAVQDLIHEEVRTDVDELFNALNISQVKRIQISDMKAVLKVYLMHYLKGIHKRGSTQRDFDRLERELEDLCFMWEDAKMWLEDLRVGLDDVYQSKQNPFTQGVTGEQVVGFTKEIGHKFGQFQQLECSNLKEKLMDMEDAGTGRVLLSQFYKGVRDPDWPFYENERYLRALGALDESNPKAPSVIIPNYLGSATLCASPSSYYKVCCLDECETLLASVEIAAAHPVASPALIAEVVSNLQSATVDAPRNLSALQISRLDDIAAMHAGQVPLHGRMFLQWMHHAYPRECRYPHVSGTINPMSAHEFGDFDATDEEMFKHIGMGDPTAHMSEDAKVAALPWSEFEELVGPYRGALSRQASSNSSVRFFLLVVTFVTATIAILRSSTSIWQVPSSKVISKTAREFV